MFRLNNVKSAYWLHIFWLSCSVVTYVHSISALFKMFSLFASDSFDIFSNRKGLNNILSYLSKFISATLTLAFKLITSCDSHSIAVSSELLTPALHLSHFHLLRHFNYFVFKLVHYLWTYILHNSQLISLWHSLIVLEQTTQTFLRDTDMKDKFKILGKKEKTKINGKFLKKTHTRVNRSQEDSLFNKNHKF